jgi:hypothetical protein
MELVQVNNNKNESASNNGLIIPEGTMQTLEIESSINNTPQFEQKPFIIANTQKATLSELKHKNIIPVFSKDNTKTLAHQEFIEIAQNCVAKAFPHHSINMPEIRVSHQIKGRTPDAIHKNAKDLLEHETTSYWERMAFIIKIPAISETVNGNVLSLTIGGIRSYNLENLYSRKTMERFKFFVGFQNQVCMNMCVWSDGFVEDLRVSSYQELQAHILQTIQNYKAENHIDLIRELPKYNLTETQFAQLIGKSRLYHYLPKKEKNELPALLLNDGQISTIAKDYYQDESFCRKENGNINLWQVYNLMTSANKSSYIDTFLSRGANAFDFTNGLKNAISGNSNHSWFLS